MTDNRTKVKQTLEESKHLKDALIADVWFRAAVVCHLEDVKDGKEEYSIEWGTLRPDPDTMHKLLDETATQCTFEHGMLKVANAYKSTRHDKDVQRARGELNKQKDYVIGVDPGSNGQTAQVITTGPVAMFKRAVVIEHT